MFVKSLFLLNKNPFLVCFNRKFTIFQKHRPKPGKLRVDYEFDDDKNPNVAYYGNPTYKFEDIKLEWIEIYYELETGDFEMGKEDIVEDYQCLQQSRLHQIAAKLAIFPFYDMVCWIISHTDVSTYNIRNSSQEVEGSFRP